MNRAIFLLLILISILSCTSDFDSTPVSICDLSDNISKIHIIQDFIPNCDNILENEMTLNLYVDGDIDVTSYTWRLNDQIVQDGPITIGGTGIISGNIDIRNNNCTIGKFFTVDLTNNNLDTYISGYCWRDSRYFEGGLAHQFDDTDYGSGPIVVELLDGETLEVLATDTTDEDSAYAFYDLTEGYYVVKFNEREMQNSFLWLKQDTTPLRASSLANELGLTQPFLLRECQSLDQVNAGFKVCFPDDDDCISQDACTYFVTREDVSTSIQLLECRTNGPLVQVDFTTPQDDYFNLGYHYKIGSSQDNLSSLLRTVEKSEESVEVTITSEDCTFSDTFVLDFDVASNFITGKVWKDNGILQNRFDSNDELISNVRVEMLEANTMEVLDTTTTNQFGIYNFMQRSGEYFIRFIKDDESEFIEKGSALNVSMSAVNQSGLSDKLNLDQCEEIHNLSAGLKQL